MSIESVAVVLHHSQMSGTAKLVMIGVANHDGDGGAWPSVKKLAVYAGVSERAVQYGIKECVAAGELKVETNAGGNDRTRDDRRPNRYHILVACPEWCDGTKNHGVKDAAPGSGNGVKLTAPRGEADGSHGVKLAAPEPSLNHPEPRESTRARASKKMLIPSDDWEPSAQTKDWCRREFPEYANHATLAAFRDHHISVASRFADWDRAFQQWVRRQPQFEARKPREPARTYL